MLFRKPRVVLAGLKGGSGKTTLSLGLLALLRSKNKTIAPFKKGPDYIDSGWLARAAGRECRNLDAFLFPEEIIIASFASTTAGCDGAVIEGNRGIFDGMDEKGTFSTARLAKLLSSPVIVAVDCTKATTTIAALVKGVLEFDRQTAVKGIILNQLAGSRHEAVIRRAIEEHTDTRVVGAVGKISRNILPERHMGLVPFQESAEVDGIINTLARTIGASLDADGIWDVMVSAPDIELPQGKPSSDGARMETGIKIGILKDEAFQFYYPENIEALTERGADIIEINALTESVLPEIDALYIGGGFPETQAIALSENKRLLLEIRKRAEHGLPVYAECGGLMFLGRRIDTGGRVLEMVGLLPLEFSMKGKPVAHGYTIVEVEGENPYYRIGTELKGHEFHYSAVSRTDEDIRMVFCMKRGKGIFDSYDGIVYKNVFATYTHLHALGSPQWADGMITVARKYRTEKAA